MSIAGDSLFSRLTSYASGDFLPMHMPGHKRNEAFAPYLQALGARLDITEIEGFDDLHDARGILKAGMEIARNLWGTAGARYLVNGSTCGILAGVHALTNPGDAVLVARNSHKAVYHALTECDLEPIYVMPPVDPATGVCGSIRPRDVADALRARPDIRLIIITSPTYEGVITDVNSIARLMPNGCALMVDEAHGAHLGLSGAFPAGATRSGADVVVHSLHKTLPSLTQTAMLHFGPRVSPERIDEALRIYETSSPSYLLMASIDECVRLLSREGPRLADMWADGLKSFERATAPLTRLRVMNYGADRGAHPDFFAFDPSKLVVLTGDTPLTGVDAGALLRQKYKIEPEMCAADYAVLMTGMGDTPEHLARLADALNEIDASTQACARRPVCALAPVPPREASARSALRAPCELVSDPLGRVSGEYVTAYPPGIPLIVPGERFTRETLDAARMMASRGVRLQSAGGAAPGLYRVVA